jgi:hypothetical protein
VGGGLESCRPVQAGPAALGIEAFTYPLLEVDDRWALARMGVHTTDSKRVSSVQLRIAPRLTRAQDTPNFHTEKIMNTRILDMTIPEVPGVCAPALADPRTTNPLVEQAWRDKLVREAAYFRSQHRRPCPGKELADWLAAERDVDESLRRSHG